MANLCYQYFVKILTKRIIYDNLNNRFRSIPRLKAERYRIANKCYLHRNKK